MTITIRNLKRRTGGRESIRERIYETDQISIGREASNDLQLLDLRIALKHARIKRDRKGFATLEMLGGQSATVNGRLKSRANGLKPGSKVRIGVYELRIEKPQTENDLTITLEQIETVEAAITAADEDTVFGLKRALPGKRLMAWTFLLVILGIFLFLPIWAFNNPNNNSVKSLPIQADLAWNSGPISLMHANLKNDCKTCHTKAFTAVTDQACAQCHTDVWNHADAKDMQTAKPNPDGFAAKLDSISETFGRSVDRCSSCHVEHNSRTKIVPASQDMCADCHKDLSTSLPHTKLLNVSDFGVDHPQFRPNIITTPDFINPVFTKVSLDDNPKGFSGLKFPHKLHLSQNGGVAQMARRVGGKFANGIDYGVDCADCHRPEAGGALFDPVNMQQDCAVCHNLVFEDDEGYARTLRHGEPNEVIASMRDFYQAKALGNIRDAEMNSRTRRRPGHAASLRDLNRRELAFKQADERTATKVNAIFSEGGACFDCHRISRPDDITTLDFAILPISVNDGFYAKSPFNHNSHATRDLTCETCHAAKDSARSSDILLPKIEVCKDCHVGEEKYLQNGKTAKRTLPSTCLTCHTFHDGPHANLMHAGTKGNDVQ